MSKSIKRGLLSILNEVSLLVVALLIAAFVWDSSHAAATPRIAQTHTPAVHTKELALPVIHHYTNEAVMLAAPVKTGYYTNTAEDSFEVVNTAELVEETNPLEEGYAHLMEHTSVSNKGQNALDSMGLTTNLDDTVMLLAKLIYSEAGPNKLDQLMAGSVVLNHVYSDEFPSIHSLIDAIIAPNHYACWPYMIKNRVPSEEAIASAKQLLSGEFPIPANIIFQAGFRQGTGGTFMMVDNKRYSGSFYNNYYCFNNSLSETDRYGNPAMSASELVSLAEALHQRDISNGLVTVEA